MANESITYKLGQGKDELVKQTKRLCNLLISMAPEDNLLRHLFLFRSRGGEQVIYLDENHPELLWNAVAKVSGFRMQVSAWEVWTSKRDGDDNIVILDTLNSAYQYEAAILPLCDVLTEAVERNGRVESGFTINLTPCVLATFNNDPMIQVVAQLESQSLLMIAEKIVNEYRGQHTISRHYTLPGRQERLENLGDLMAKIIAIKEYAHIEIVPSGDYLKLFSGGPK